MKLQHSINRALLVELLVELREASRKKAIFRCVFKLLLDIIWASPRYSSMHSRKDVHYVRAADCQTLKQLGFL